MSTTANPTKLAVTAAYNLWAHSYDTIPNSMLALEERCFSASVKEFRGQDIVELGCGTGRWLQRLEGVAKSLIGIDSSQAMLARARAKCANTTRLVWADCLMLPLPDNSADCIVSSFVISHISDIRQFAREIARVARPGAAIVLSDLHPDRAAHGWRPTFRAPDGLVEVETYSYSLQKLVDVMQAEGCRLTVLDEPSFGEEEAAIFEQAGKLDYFHQLASLPVMYRARFVTTKEAARLT